jgi:mannosyl-glycoprotein endo-beta-N-acetylglucosaminidase
VIPTPLAQCLVIAIAVAALPACTSGGEGSGTSPVVDPTQNVCGAYQCFSNAHDFWRSVPAPKPEQVATVPLRTRAVGAAPGMPRMLVGLDNGPWAFWDVSDGFAQGRSGVIGDVPAGNVFNFRYWQYVDELYYYLHETVSVPPTQWINAAHRNGVPVFGTVTSDCDGCGPEAKKLFRPRDYDRTVRKLYDYAAAYGFDGWVIDLEGDDFVPSPSLFRAVQELERMTLPNGSGMRVVLYHANEFSLGPLLSYFQAGAEWQSDYDSSTHWPARTYRTLVAHDLQALNQRAFWASYVYNYQGRCRAGERTTESQIWNGNRTPGTEPECLDTAGLFANQRAIVPTGPGTPPSYTSAALFAPIWPYAGNLPDQAAPRRRARVHAAEDALWVGSGVQYTGPSCERSGTDNAVSALIAPRSVVGELPFVTNFNEGEGDTYAVQGTQVAAVPWNNLSVQDVLPTWSCRVRGGLTAAIAYAATGSGDSFNGGSALRLSGAEGEVQLYEADVPVSASARPIVGFVSKSRKGPPPYVRIGYRDGSSDLVPATTNSPEWSQTISALSAPGKTITTISVGAEGNGSEQVAARLGQLRVYDANADAQPTAITVDSDGPLILWSTTGAPVSSWNVYLSAGSCLRYLGPSLTNSYRVPQAMFRAGPRTGRYVIQPVSAAGSVPEVGPICRARGSAHRP